MNRFCVFTLAVASLAALFSCEKTEKGEEVPPVTAPEISVSGLTDDAQKSITVKAAAEECSFNYEIINPSEGISLKTETDQDWINNLMAEDGKVTFTVSANGEESSRTATITLSYEGAASVKVSVIQEGSPVITVSQQEPVSAEAEGGEYSFTYEIANPVDGVQLNVFANADWITIKSASDGKVSFTVAANETATIRSANITLSYKGAKNVTITVNQTVGEEIPVPEVEVTDFNVNGSTVSFTVTPNEATYKWTAVLILNNDKAMNSKSDQEIYDGWIQDGVNGPNAKGNKITYMGFLGQMPVSINVPGMNPAGDYFLAIAAIYSNGTCGKLQKMEFTIK